MVPVGWLPPRSVAVSWKGRPTMAVACASVSIEVSVSDGVGLGVGWASVGVGWASVGVGWASVGVGWASVGVGAGPPSSQPESVSTGFLGWSPENETKVPDWVGGQ